MKMCVTEPSTVYVIIYSRQIRYFINLAAVLIVQLQILMLMTWEALCIENAGLNSNGCLTNNIVTTM